MAIFEVGKDACLSSVMKIYFSTHFRCWRLYIMDVIFQVVVTNTLAVFSAMEIDKKMRCTLPNTFVFRELSD